MFAECANRLASHHTGGRAPGPPRRAGFAPRTSFWLAFGLASGGWVGGRWWCLHFIFFGVVRPEPCRRGKPLAVAPLRGAGERVL